MTYPAEPPEGRLYCAHQTRELDRLTITQCAIPGFELMKQAGRSAYRALRQHWPAAKRILVLCGSGNNGGDGMVLAGLAVEHQQQVQVRLVGGEEAVKKLKGEALEAYQWALDRGVSISPYDPCAADFSSTDPSITIDADVIVDALLGTGLQGKVRGDYGAAISDINASALPVLAIDIPSGLCSDRGVVLGTAVKADITVSFIGLKRGLYTEDGIEHRGKVVFDSLQVPQQVYRQVLSDVGLIDQHYISRWLAPRSRTAHKGSCGHLLVVGGDLGMGGAVMMAAEAAARSGAGLVSVATRPENVCALNVRCPEVMAHGVASLHDLELLCGQATAVLIGPGLGQSAWSTQVLYRISQLDIPAVWDADALNMLASDLDKPGLDKTSSVSRRENRIITPHPGEASRLLNLTTAEVQADRFLAVEKLYQLFGGVAVLKGAGTLIYDGKQTQVCRRGNPGMATGGMGDVLAGICGGLLAQRLEPMAAASVAVEVHSHAADLCAKASGERGMVATDLFQFLRPLLNPAAYDSF